MVPNTILAFSATSATTLVVGLVSVYAHSSQARLLAAKIFVFCITASAIFVCMQTDSRELFGIIHFCTLIPVLSIWTAVLIRYELQIRQSAAQKKAIDKLEASLHRTTEDETTPVLSLDGKSKR